MISHRTPLFQKIKSFLFRNTTPGQTVAKNVFWLGVSSVVGRLVRALIIIYAARVLGAAEWGAFSYAITIIAFLTIFTDFGMNSVLTRERSKINASHEEQKQVLSTAFFIKLVLLAVGMVVVVFVTPHLTNITAVKHILPLVGLILVFDTLREFGFSLIRAYEKMEREAFLFILTNVSIVVFGIILLKISPSLQSFTYAYVLGTGLGMVATFISLSSHLKELFGNFSSRLVRPLMASAWPFALAGLLGGLMVNTDVIVIGWLRNAEAVGFYSAAQRILLLLYLVPGVLGGGSFPLLSRVASEKNHEKARSVLEKTLTACLLLALPIMLGGIALGPRLLGVLFGESYLSATLSTQILLITLPFNFSAIILSNLVFAYNEQKKLIVYAGVGGIMNVILDIILIKQWGIAGSAAATLIVQVISTTYLWHITNKKILSFSVFPYIKKMSVAAVLMGILTFILLPYIQSTFLVIGISALFYCAVLYILKENILQEGLRMFRQSSIER